MAAFGADVVGRRDLDLPIDAPGAPKRGELSGHPHRPGRWAGSLRPSVRFVRGDLPLHLPAASRTAATPAKHGANPGPCFADRAGLLFKATACAHFGASIGDRRDPDNLKKPSCVRADDSIRLQARPRGSSSDAVAARFADIVDRGHTDSLGRMRRPIRIGLPPANVDHPGGSALLADVRPIRAEPSNHPPAASRTAALPPEHGANPGPQLDEWSGFSLEPTVLGHETSVGNPHRKDHTRRLKETSTSPNEVAEPE